MNAESNRQHTTAQIHVAFERAAAGSSWRLHCMWRRDGAGSGVRGRDSDRMVHVLRLEAIDRHSFARLSCDPRGHKTRTLIWRPI